MTLTPPAAPTTSRTVRQQVLVLYTATSALDDRVIAWSSYDGTGRTHPTMGDSDEPPYKTGLEALIDGWRLLQLSQLQAHQPGHEYDVAYLPYEFVFERIVDLSA